MVSKLWDWNSASAKLSSEINFFFSVESLTLSKVDRITIIRYMTIIKTSHKNSDSSTATFSALRGGYRLHNRPTTQETGVVRNIERSVHHCFAENISIVNESVAEDPNMSIPRRS